MVIEEMESSTPRNWALLSLYPFAAVQCWDFSLCTPQIITGDVGDISYEIQPLSGGTNNAQQLKIETGLKLFSL